MLQLAVKMKSQHPVVKVSKSLSGQALCFSNFFQVFSIYLGCFTPYINAVMTEYHPRGRPQNISVSKS